MINKVIKIFKEFGLVDANNDQIILTGLRYLGNTLMDFLFAIICSFIMGDVLVGILFEICYGMLRIYAGGYHAPNERICKYLTYMSTLLSLLIIFVIPFESNVMHCMMFLVVCIIILNSPIQSENKPLNNMEIKMYRRYCLAICIVEVILYYICMNINMVLYAKTVCIAMILVSHGLVAETVIKYKCRKMM